MKKYFVYFITSFLPLCFCATLSHALNVETHKALNEYIATKVITPNGFSLEAYLIDQLKFGSGIEEKFTANGETHTVWEWLRDGGEYEDVPRWYLMYLRSKNHFHNPINEQGFSGIWDTGVLSGMSATQWALLPQNTQGPGGYYSWADVRNYYFNALTSTNKTTRDTNFAETFRGVGQLMHLVQDMSVPEHTRNDGHYVPYIAYEDWVAYPGNVNISALTPFFFTGAISSIKSFMDTNRYTGSNPEVTAYSTIGLSEFSNANFFSDDSIFTGFTYPSIAGAELWLDTSLNRQYLKKTSEGVPVEHLATVSLLYFYRWRYFPQEGAYLPLGLDSKVYSDYASLLLPRAVGYSAGLLNYFFRGKMDMEPDPNTSGQYIIKNKTGEIMNGTFSLYYDDASDNRYQVSGATWNLSIDANGQSSSLTFTAPTDAKIKGKYILAFKGTLGSEIGNAVVGKAVDLCSSNAGIMVISGPDAPTDGSQYTATGGIEPYTWSITKGSITQTGVVTISGQCGSATVTAADTCGNEVTREVSMPTGVYVFINAEILPPSTCRPDPNASNTIDFFYDGGFGGCSNDRGMFYYDNGISTEVYITPVPGHLGYDRYVLIGCPVYGSMNNPLCQTTPGGRYTNYVEHNKWRCP